MATDPAASQTMLEAFGLSLKEILALTDLAHSSISSPLLQLSRGYLREASPAACQAIRNALLAPWTSAYSEAGRGTMILLMTPDQPEALATWDDVLTTLLANPVMLRDVVIWCLFFATLEGAARFQLNDCPSPSEEGHLSGLLLGTLSASCEKWRRTASAPLDRSGTSLSLQRIDLTILGGEQVTGGDFGLILDFDDRDVQTGGKGKGLGRRIVPLIFPEAR